ncbi:tRNA-splicing endonuclease subunit Sen34 [Brachyhypopomus gauderio]|uniref:tRNA-splicing endonuclease subunit Sen34 n=1 Tax=Brachyhypopomus gauderio TaxID=698409 RepID=UPI0040417ECD
MDWQTTELEDNSVPNGQDTKATECESAIAKSDQGNEAKDRTIKIRLCGSTPLLWRSADVKTAREEFGVIGTLVGSLPRQPRQNTRLGRPLEILQEEARLLLETGQATALQHPDKGNEVSESEESHQNAVQLYQASLDCSYEEQCTLALEDKKAVLHRVMSEKQNSHSGNDGAERAVRQRLCSLKKSFTFPRSAMAIQLYTAHAGFSHCPEELGFLAADWPAPRDKRSDARFQVYKDLRRRGFYLTTAGKFGGDYLVYPGDPLRFHAHFIALCMPLDEPSPISDILAIARLGSNVKKTVLLCSPRDPSDGHAEGDVVYSSLQWSGMA